MDSETRLALLRLLQDARVAALGTLHAGEAAVSLVPFAPAPGRDALLIHVSALAAHTRDLLDHPRASLMLNAAPGVDTDPLAVPRLSIAVDAQPLARDGADYVAARAAYLQRLPSAEITFELGDFQLFRLTPREARWIGGFGRARTLDADTLIGLLRQI